MSQRRSTRRGFLGASVATVGGLAGCIAGSDGVGTDDGSVDETTRDDEDPTRDSDDETLDPPENGAVVFVYDDGPMEDYTQAFPVHREFDAPATAGIVTEWIGRENYQNSGCMNVDHLTELADAGWEIASHTTEHTAVGTFELVADADPGDGRVYPEHFRHGYHDGKPLEVTDGDRTVHRTVVDNGSDDVGRYIDLDESLGTPFAAGETVVRYPEDQMRESLRESKRELEGLGFEIDTFLAPYDNFDDYSRSFVTEYYDGVANARHGSRINDPEGFDPYETRRAYFVEFTTREPVERDVDEIAERGALGVFGAHTFKEEVSEKRIRETLEWIDERDVEVLTLREAIARFTDDDR